MMVLEYREILFTLFFILFCVFIYFFEELSLNPELAVLGMTV